MKIVKMVCPNCGATLQIDADKKNLTCNYCGNNLFIDDEVQHIQYDNAEEAGYQFEKGRQRAQSEIKTYESKNQVNVCSTQPQKKSLTWLWVLGWIFIFPVPLTILVVRSKSMKIGLKIVIISIVWIVYLFIGLFGGGDKNNENSSNDIQNSTDSSSVSVSSDEAQEETLPILYADDDKINIWLNRYNALYPNSALTSEDFNVYYHHGGEHKSQIQLTIDGFPIVISSGKAVITCYKNQKTNEDCKKLFCKIVPVYCPNLSETEILERWDTTMDDLTNTTTFDDNLYVSFRIFSDSIEMMEIDGDLA